MKSSRKKGANLTNYSFWNIEKKSGRNDISEKNELLEQDIKNFKDI